MFTRSKNRQQSVQTKEEYSEDITREDTWHIFKQNYDIFAIATGLEIKKKQQQIGIFKPLWSRIY